MWKQNVEFETFNGPILFTTNCIVPPRKNAGYKDRIYTTGASGLEGAIKKFFVMAGCDGRMKSREYYTEFAEQLPATPLS